jgi:hypothetical protein
LNKPASSENINLHKILDDINSNTTITAEKNYSSNNNISKTGTAIKLAVCFWKSLFTDKQGKTNSRLINSVLASSEIFLSNIKLLKLKGKL